jgi:anthranilate phosphoribosyltransferase
MVKVRAPEGRVLDTCGTGGDSKGTFNFSTMAAIVAAACGVTVAKHGNRAATSKCGSADLLERLGVRIERPVERVEACLREAGIAYLHAPAFHPALKHAAPIRRELGFRTVFNALGPLVNPAGADTQALGVANPAWIRPFAEVLRRLGTREAFVFHGEGGLDEISLIGVTRAIRLKDGCFAEVEITPEQAGLSRARLDDILGGDAATNAAIATDILAGKRSPYRDGTVLSTAIALIAAGKAETPAEGARLAEAAIDGGAARRTLERLKELTR